MSKEVDEIIIDRAANKSNTGAYFSKDMSKEEIKKALKLARKKAKDFHKKKS